MTPVLWLEPFISGGAGSFNVSLSLYLLEIHSEVYMFKLYHVCKLPQNISEIKREVVKTALTEC